MYIYVRVCVCVCVCVCMCSRMCVMHVRTYVYICLLLYMYTVFKALDLAKFQSLAERKAGVSNSCNTSISNCKHNTQEQSVYKSDTNQMGVLQLFCFIDV